MMVSLGYLVSKLNRKLEGQKVLVKKIEGKYLITFVRFGNGMTEIFFKEKSNLVTYLINLI